MPSQRSQFSPSINHDNSAGGGESFRPHFTLEQQNTFNSNLVMRIHILSDLHLEFAPFQPDSVVADVIVLAGDVHTGMNGFKWIRETFPAKPVVYVLGNHEFYGQKIPKLIEEIKEAATGSNIHILENNHVEICGVVFLGATLWTDFRLNGDVVLAEVTAQTGMTDFRRIRVTPSYRRFRPADARRLHRQSLDWLVQQTEAARGSKVVVVTHHAPSPRSISERFQKDPLNPAFASDLESFIATGNAALWIHGHIHQHSDYIVGSTRVVANPRGYPGEIQIGFKPSLVIEV
jgi:Icc-related predicted phosphoesterase